MTLFSYGSLVFPEVMRAVTGRSFAHEPGRLFGWRRTRFRARTYPGIQADAAASTPGTLWHGIDLRSAQRLDCFETSDYERRILPVRAASGAELQAHVYVVRAESLHLLSQEPWERPRFARESLAGFLRRLRR
ncbi:MAG TPA: gamma-glutamylcyclotransferase family protein [Myxococcota bacterium]|nr:gamma-glutamylcyclotransferase family protein [Myxococcota bacterium]